MSKDERIGKRPDDKPAVTISGGAIPPAADTVNLGGDYYARLDMPHHKATIELCAELKAIVKTWLSNPPKTKKVTTTNDDE